jgi:hypothetical protein
VAVPELVGTTLIRPSSSWASSYTIRKADLPEGTRNGDRIVLWLLGSGSGTTANATGANQPRGRWGLSVDWSFHFQARLFAWVNVYSIRYLPGVLPVTISPTKADETAAPTGDYWQGLITVYRPSKSPNSDYGFIKAFNTDSTLPGSPPSASDPTPIAPDGLVVGVGHIANTSKGIVLTTANGYTQRSYFAEVGATPVASAVMHLDGDYDAVFGSGSSAKVPTLTTSDGSGTGGGGVMVFMSMVPTPDTPSYADEWGVGTIRF